IVIIAIANNAITWMIEKMVFILPVVLIPIKSNAVIAIETTGATIVGDNDGKIKLKYPAKPRFTAPAAKANDRKYRPEHHNAIKRPKSLCIGENANFE